MEKKNADRTQVTPPSEGTTTQECRGLPCGGTPKVRAKNKQAKHYVDGERTVCRRSRNELGEEEKLEKFDTKKICRCPGIYTQPNLAVGRYDLAGFSGVAG